MKRRTFLGSTAATIAVSGCLGGASPTQIDHQQKFKTEIENRGVGVRGLEVTEDDIVRVGYTSESSNEDLAEVAMAFVERIDAGWQVKRLRGLGYRAEMMDLTWIAEVSWVQDYLDEEINAAEYGQRISDTLEQTVIIDGGDVVGEDRTNSSNLTNAGNGSDDSGNHRNI